MASKKYKVENPKEKVVINYGNFMVDVYYGETVYRCLPNKKVSLPIDAVIPFGVTLREIKK